MFLQKLLCRAVNLHNAEQQPELCIDVVITNFEQFKDCSYCPGRKVCVILKLVIYPSPRAFRGSLSCRLSMCLKPSVAWHTMFETECKLSPRFATCE